MKKFFFLTVAVCGILASCNKEQTSLSINDIKDSATIMGKVVYSEGTGYDGKAFLELIKPAANITVTAKISNSKLSPNGQASGYTYIETTTNDNGEYELTVPVVETNGAMIVELRPAPFAGTRHRIEGFDNRGSVIWAQDDVVFELTTAKTVAVSPKDIKIQDIAYGFTPRNADESYPFTVGLNVLVGQSAFFRISGQGSSTTVPYLAPANGANVVIEVAYNNYYELNSNTTLTRTFALTTNYNGEASFNIPAKDTKVSFNSITAKVIPYDGNMYYYNRDGQGFTVNGTYRLWGNYIFNDDNTTSLGVYYIDGETTKLVRMVLDPASNDSSGYSPAGYNWSSITEIGFNTTGSSN